MTLGLIYMKEFGGAEDERRSSTCPGLAPAARPQPDQPPAGELTLAPTGEGSRPLSGVHPQRAPDDPDAAGRRKALEDLEREIRKRSHRDQPPARGRRCALLEPELQRMINEAYLRGTEYQDWRRPRRSCSTPAGALPEGARVSTSSRAWCYQEDRTGDARQLLGAEPQIQEDQLEVHERLGLLLRQLPEEAIPHLMRAAELGSCTPASCWPSCCGARPAVEARDQLETLPAVRRATTTSSYDRAQALREEMDRRLFPVLPGGGRGPGDPRAGAGLEDLSPLPRLLLRQLLERDPKSFPEVARILSLIRHEILKHNTAFLADVGRALEIDAPDAEQRAEVLSRRLFGDPTAADGRGGRGERSDGGPAGIYGRFLGYIDDLEKVARAHRVTLNLHRKDPIFRPMIVAFEDLARWAPAMRDGHRLRPGKKLEIARVLRRSGRCWAARRSSGSRPHSRAVRDNVDADS